MRRIILSIILLIYICSCKTVDVNSKEHVGSSVINRASDVVIINDSTPMSSDIPSSEIEYLLSKHFIGISYRCNQDTITKLVHTFPPNVMKAIHSYGKDIIPYLISQIDIDKYGLAGFVNPYESNLQDVVILSPMGINYAYMVELIMAKDSIMSDSIAVNGLSSWEEKMKPYRIYGQCVIIRKEDINNPSVSKITIADMKIIKTIYSDWWEINKNVDVDSLRKEWRENGTPLQLSSFTWI